MLSEPVRYDAVERATSGDLCPGLLPGDDFVAAMFSGGDSRMALDPRSGLNRYLCPQVPAPELVCASSCTASPVSAAGFARASAAYLNIIGAASPRERGYRLAALIEQIKRRLLGYFHADRLAHIILGPSGTDAMLTAAMLIAAERPNEVMTAIIPSARETGSGVPMAVACRIFDGADTGKPLCNGAGTTVEIPLRRTDGSPRCQDEVDAAFAAAMTAARGHVVVCLTHGTKTGLIAPLTPLPGANVMVDACQTRIEPATVAAYLSRGWPVVVTGSKFFGGPAFSGAVLLPRGQLRAAVVNEAADLGTALRWTAAMPAIDAFECQSARMAGVLGDAAVAVNRALHRNPALVPIAGLQISGSGWACHPSIFTFAVRDPRDPHRLLSALELRLLYERLASRGVLIGQPVNLESFGGLRIAVGGQSLLDGSETDRLERVFATLQDVTDQDRRTP